MKQRIELSTLGFIILTIATSAHAKITALNTGTFTATEDSSTFTTSFNAGQGGTADKLIISTHRETGGTITSITYHGDALTFLKETESDERNGGLWVLDSPYSGGEADIVITFSEPAKSIGLAFVSLKSLSGKPIALGSVAKATEPAGDGQNSVRLSIDVPVEGSGYLTLSTFHTVGGSEETPKAPETPETPDAPGEPGPKSYAGL